MPERDQSRRVAAYYDHNTLPFMRVGGSGLGLAAIHREVWAPGILDSHAAFLYLNELVHAWLPRPLREDSAVLDLGCGLGGTMTWLASRTPCPLVGVTLSAVQVRLAEQRAEQLGLAARCRFLRADITELPELPKVQAAYAIEALIHVESAARFFEQAAQVLPVGGQLIVCDDFLAERREQDASKERWIERFKQGWHADGLATLSTVKQAARDAGFELVEERNLSPYLRTVPTPVVELGAWLLKLPLLRGSYWDSLRGSTALQRCVRRGWTEYHALAWRRIASAHGAPQCDDLSGAARPE